jgi:hypothetical protein
MNRTVKTVAISGVALLTAFTLSACGTTSTSETSTREQRQADYENTLRLWLAADAEEKAAACDAVTGGSDSQRLALLPAGLGLQVTHASFDEEFLQGRC